MELTKYFVDSGIPIELHMWYKFSLFEFLLQRQIVRIYLIIKFKFYIQIQDSCHVYINTNDTNISV